LVNFEHLEFYLVIRRRGYLPMCQIWLQYVQWGFSSHASNRPITLMRLFSFLAGWLVSWLVVFLISGTHPARTSGRIYNDTLSRKDLPVGSEGKIPNTPEMDKKFSCKQNFFP